MNFEDAQKLAARLRDLTLDDGARFEAANAIVEMAKELHDLKDDAKHAAIERDLNT